MSDPGERTSRPYPPRATTAIRPGNPSNGAHRARTASSTSPDRRRADQRPWCPGEYARSSAPRDSFRRSSGSGPPAGDGSDRVGAHLPSADPDHLLGGEDEDLPVPDLPRPGGLGDGVDDALD